MEDSIVKIAFLGLGKMGIAVARRLRDSGADLVVWNRSPKSAEDLAMKVAATPQEAVSGRDVVFTMLNDDEAVRDVVLGAGGVAAAMAAGAIHVSLSTISVELSANLTEEHRRRGQIFVAAPVFGRPNVAEAGKLWIAVAGDASAIERIRPLLETASRGITVVGSEPKQAHALKLGGNFLITSMIQGLSEGFVFAAANGIDPAVFLETVNSALFQSPFYAAYGKVMLEPPPQPGATIALGIKDICLLLEAARADGVRLPLAEYLAGKLQLASETGLTHEDWAVGQYRLAQSLSKPKAPGQS
jgi:3-hydroxyisobutyrate dehydrogenase-like beta-hydroxyacid dehydrogenase